MTAIRWPLKMLDRLNQINFYVYLFISKQYSHNSLTCVLLRVYHLYRWGLINPCAGLSSYTTGITNLALRSGGVGRRLWRWKKPEEILRKMSKTDYLLYLWYNYRPITAPEGSRRLRLPDYNTIVTCRWKSCQPYTPAAFTPPGNNPSTHFY